MTNFNNLTSVFNLAPNPVKDAVTLNITASSENQLQVYFYDVNGELKKILNTKVQKGSNSMRIGGLNDWQSGVYVIKIILGNEAKMAKMLVMH